MIWGHSKVRKHNLYYTISAALGLFLSYSIYIFADENSKIFLGREDGPYEIIGAIFFLLSSIVFFITFFKSKSNKNVFFLLLGLLFLFAFFEEISWGQ